MAIDDTDRRRLFLALVVTCIALPAFWFVARSDGSAATDSGPITTSEIAASGDGAIADPAAAPPTTVGRTNRPALETSDDDPIFMDGPAADPNGGIAEIAVPAKPETEPMEMSATYRDSIPGVRTCLVRGLSTGETVVVKNLDNGRSVTCVTQIAPASQADDLVLHTEMFEQLADLTDAPIPVEVQR